MVPVRVTPYKAILTKQCHAPQWLKMIAVKYPTFRCSQYVANRAIFAYGYVVGKLFCIYTFFVWCDAVAIAIAHLSGHLGTLLEQFRPAELKVLRQREGARDLLLYTVTVGFEKQPSLLAVKDHRMRRLCRNSIWICQHFSQDIGAHRRLHSAPESHRTAQDWFEIEPMDGGKFSKRFNDVRNIILSELRMKAGDETAQNLTDPRVDPSENCLNRTVRRTASVIRGVFTLFRGHFGSHFG
ncbi:hypothetical protein PH5382_03850 [Phaeobacter sp. CECT 5382]|nr:hypothetical protein PH5382_03850 [Phaeobacter sp. CECT 5382]